jgi:uncharacterized protein (TIGR02145 family)
MRLFIQLKRWAILLVAVLAMTAQLTPAQQQYWTGDGGKGIRLVALEPVGKGLTVDEQWMLSLVQGAITADFNKYSAITVIDRLNLEKVFAGLKDSVSGSYSDADRAQIGNLTGAGHILTGSVSKNKNVFTLELSVTDVASGERKATYSAKSVSAPVLEELSAIKAASADLLRQLGVKLTDAAQGELRQAANMAQIQAQTMLSRGIAVRRRGAEVAALSYFYRAAALDASLVEASKRSSAIAAHISKGAIGAGAQDDATWRNGWVARLKETEETFYNIINSANPPYTLYYSTQIEVGDININHQMDTTKDLNIYIELNADEIWFKTLNRTLQAAQTVLDGLNATNRKKDWGLANWPEDGVSGKNPFAGLKCDTLKGCRPNQYSKQYDTSKVVFEAVNEKGRAICSQAIRLYPAFSIFRDNNNRIIVKFDENTPNAVNIKGVKANDIGDNLTVRISSVNGVPPEKARFAIVAILIDARNGKRYNTVKIGNKRWMAENLNYRIGNSRCYEYDEPGCNKYGLRYDWYTAMAACPVYWRLPARNEWSELIDMTNEQKSAGKKLKTANGWGYNGNGTDDYGFSALPGGYIHTDGKFYGVGYYGYWWTATAYDNGYAYYRDMLYGNDLVGEDFYNKEYGISVRCLQDVR